MPSQLLLVIVYVAVVVAVVEADDVTVNVLV